jgi:nitrogen fixation protein FixH
MTGWRVWWYFVAFFGFIAAVNAAMVALAIRTHSGVVTEHPYEKGLAYNEVVQAEEKQEALGWKGSIEYKNGVLIFTLHNQHNIRINLEKMTATITRPTQQGMDFTVELKGAETPVSFPAVGLWEVRIDAVHEGVHYQQSKRIVVQ